MSLGARARTLRNAHRATRKMALLVPLREAVGKIGISEAARRVGVHRRTVANALSIEGNPRFRFLWDLFKACEIKWEIRVMTPEELAERDLVYAQTEKIEAEPCAQEEVQTK